MFSLDAVIKLHQESRGAEDESAYRLILAKLEPGL